MQKYGTDPAHHVIAANEGNATVFAGRDLAKVTGELGYEKCYQAEGMDSLEKILTEISSDAVGPIFLEVKCAIGARDDLGRPTTSARENKEAFMRGL